LKSVLNCGHFFTFLCSFTTLTGHGGLNAVDTKKRVGNRRTFPLIQSWAAKRVADELAINYVITLMVLKDCPRRDLGVFAALINPMPAQK